MLLGLVVTLEKTNRIFERVLRHFAAADMRDWEKHLRTAQFANNNSWQQSVQDTPMFLRCGRHPKSPLLVQLPSATATNPA